MEPAIRTEGLTKRYGSTLALDRLDLAVQEGEVYGFLGPNGAGKTTTINMVLGVLQPSAGQIRIEGVDLARHRSQALSHTNFAAVYAALPGNLTVEQNLLIFGMSQPMSNGAASMHQRVMWV